MYQYSWISSTTFFMGLGLGDMLKLTEAYARRVSGDLVALLRPRNQFVALRGTHLNPDAGPDAHLTSRRSHELGE